MKQYNWILAATLLLITACHSNATGSLTWAENGIVTNAGGKKLQLDINGVYDDLSYEGLHYLAGFKIDKEGNNHPHIVQVDDDFSSIKYWPFDFIANDIFIYQENIHVVSTEGEVYKLQKGEWQLTSLHLPPESQIVYSDKNTNLVVCYPAALVKTVSRNSGCKSWGNEWQHDFVWYTQVPKMCDGKLYAVAQEVNSNVLKRIDINTGKIISSSSLKQKPENICSL